VIAGFFDTGLDATQRWSIGRHQVIRRLLARRTLVSPPAAVLGCPAWFAADAVTMIANARGPARRLPEG
jgi:iron complex transport system substrate-binding protein